MRPLPTRRAGFTLVEIVVVIACLALVVGLTMPALSGAMAASRSMRCQTNLRQLATATFAYSAVYNGWSPASILYFKRDAGVEIAAWDFVHHPDGTVSPGALWAFADADPRVHQCPDFTGSATFEDDPYTGYNYNTSFVGAEGRFPQIGADGEVHDGWEVARRGVPPSQHACSSATVLFGDGGWSGGANKFMRAPMNTVELDLQLVYAGGQAYRHRACCNVVHLDGHCASVSTACPGKLATAPLLEEIMDHPRNGFLTDDDRAYDPRLP